METPPGLVVATDFPLEKTPPQVQAPFGIDIANEPAIKPQILACPSSLPVAIAELSGLNSRDNRSKVSLTLTCRQVEGKNGYGGYRSIPPTRHGFHPD